jgi:glycogen(starch) synthase
VKIAFVSYEYPPDNAFGGIATYTQQAARMLARRGHAVDVFAGSGERDGTFSEQNVSVHRIRCDGIPAFRRRLPEILVLRSQAINGFDLLEMPEQHGEAVEALRRLPQLPFVLRLHTPSYLFAEISDLQWGWRQKARFALGALRRGQWPQFAVAPDGVNQFERAIAAAADGVLAPSRAIAQRVGDDWQLSPEILAHVPYPFVPDPALLNIAPGADAPRVVFVGRLEPRKGVHTLARAIPGVLRRHPDVKFRFVGRDLHSPVHGVSMRQHIESICSSHLSALEFIGPVPAAELPRHLAAGAIAVFPSVWENFPNACLEAMAAARAVVGSNAGGMADMLEDGAGILVPPKSPSALTDAIARLLEAPATGVEMGLRARQRVQDAYGSDQIGPRQEAAYARAIAHRNDRGPRPPDALPMLPAA